jgi:Cu(I)/Ag(I) efflux system periplasmic protein CusF
MKPAATLAAMAAILTAAPALALAQQAGGGPAPRPAAQTAEGVGVIKAIDAKAGAVTIAHDPIPALGWPAMTMKFKVASPAVLHGAAVGRKAHFVLQNQGGKPVVTQIHPF